MRVPAWSIKYVIAQTRPARLVEGAMIIGRFSGLFVECAIRERPLKRPPFNSLCSDTSLTTASLIALRADAERRHFFTDQIFL